MEKRMPSFTFRLPLMLSRKLRAISKVYGSQPGPFVRDLIEATIEGGLHNQLFKQRLEAGMERYKDKPVLLGGKDAGGFTAPGKPAKKGSKQARQGKEPPVA